MSVIESLGQTLLTIMLVQLLGYVMKRLDLLPGFEAGVGLYLGMVALPSLLFSSVATLDLGAIEPALIAAVVLAKSIVATLAAVIGRLYTKTSEPPGTAYALCGLMALATTNSDDVGLGLPVMQAMFPPSSASAALVPLLFVLSALQNLIFNPICFVLLGLGAARIAASDAASKDGAAATAQPTTASILLGVLRGLRKNPLIISVVGGLAYNLIAAALTGNRFGSELPWFLKQPLTLLGRAFTPLVLFLAGSASVGSFSRLASVRAAALPALWVGLQSFLLPFLARIFLQTFGCSADMVSFGFVYGILPCANSVLVVARGYKLNTELLGSLSAYLALGKVLAFPLLFLAGVLSEIADDAAALLSLRASASTVTLAMSSAGLGFILLSALGVEAWRRCPLRRVLGYIFLQGAFSILHLCEPLVASGSASSKTALFVCTSFARWAAPGLAAVLAFEDARKARALFRARALAAQEKHAAPSEVETDMLSDFSHNVHLGVSAGLGVALTLPWAVACEMPESPCLLLWVPYEGRCGTAQRIAYLVAYVIVGIVVTACLIVTLASARTKVSSGTSGAPCNADGGGRGACNGERRLSLGEETVCERGTSYTACQRSGTKLRLRIILVLVAATSVFHAVLLSSVLDAEHESSCTLTPAFALGLLMLVTLVDGQGIYIFALFGLQPEILDALRRWAARLSQCVDSRSCVRVACCISNAAVGDEPVETDVLTLTVDCENSGSTELPTRATFAAPEPEL